jgi:hypothetical protein
MGQHNFCVQMTYKPNHKSEKSICLRYYRHRENKIDVVWGILVYSKLFNHSVPAKSKVSNIFLRISGRNSFYYYLIRKSVTFCFSVEYIIINYIYHKTFVICFALFMTWCPTMSKDCKSQFKKNELVDKIFWTWIHEGSGHFGVLLSEQIIEFYDNYSRDNKLQGAKIGRECGSLQRGKIGNVFRILATYLLG